MKNVYRRRLPALARHLLYPDSSNYNMLPGRGIRIEENVRITGPQFFSPLAPKLGMWPETRDAAKTSHQLPDYFSATLQGALLDTRYNLITTPTGAPFTDSTSTVLPVDGSAWVRRIRKNIEPISGICCSFRSVHNGVYHTLIDNMSRIFFLRQACYQSLDQINLLLTSPVNPQEKFYLDRYLPKNVNLLLVPDDRYLRPDRLIFSSFLPKRTLSYLPKFYLDDFLPCFLPKRPRKRRHRIFVSRRSGVRSAMRVIENEDLLMSALAAKGFRRYFLEDMSFEEQIELFYDAESVVAAHGAGLANLIFSENVKVVELHPSKLLIPNFHYICLSMGHSYSFWKGTRNHFNDAFTVDVERVKSLIDQQDLLSV